MIYSKTYPKETPMACSRCVFGQGAHEPWCEKATPCPNCAHRDGPTIGSWGRMLSCPLCGRFYDIDDGNA